MTINIGFWTNQLCERGTEIAVFDYAYHNEKILNNKSFIFYERNNVNNNDEVIKKFKKYFTVIDVNVFSDIDVYLKEHNINILYNIKAGNNDGKLSKYAKNIIHCVFTCQDPHGDVYCAISKDVKHYNQNYKILPHIVDLPVHNKNMRNHLQIPDEAIVYGRIGGKEQFDIPFVQKAVYDIALDRPDIYFLFVNTNQFCPSLKNIIHLNQIIDLNEKRTFINTCDAMIWGRNMGETFGLGIAEFSICNKPVIAMKIGDLAHASFLGDKGIWYNNYEDLIKIFFNLNKDYIKSKEWNVFLDFTPEKVMKTFEEIAIKPFVDL
jgi:hypothetical protein